MRVLRTLAGVAGAGADGLHGPGCTCAPRAAALRTSGPVGQGPSPEHVAEVTRKVEAEEARIAQAKAAKARIARAKLPPPPIDMAARIRASRNAADVRPFTNVLDELDYDAQQLELRASDLTAALEAAIARNDEGEALRLRGELKELDAQRQKIADRVSELRDQGYTVRDTAPRAVPPSPDVVARVRAARGATRGERVASILRGSLRKAIVLALVACAAIGLSCRNDRWEGFVYPSKDDLTVHRALGEFSSLESCRDACLAMLQDLDSLESGDYECGKNCRSERGMTVRICEETLR